MSEKEEGRGKSKLEEELSRSMSGRHVENGIVNSAEENFRDDDVAEHGPEEKKRKRRHTPLQIRELERLFKECPNPDVKQQLELSKQLGLKPCQISAWFQNRRRRMKVHQHMTENATLKAEIENLKNDIVKLQAAPGNKTCPNCSGSFILGKISDGTQHLRLENASLDNQLESGSRNTVHVHTQSQSLMLPLRETDLNVYSTYFNSKQ